MTQIIAGSKEFKQIRQEILSTLGVVPTSKFKVKEAVRNRVNYLKSFLKSTGRKAFILGISGGVDSTAVGRLCQIACEELREEGYPALFVAMRLPSGIQKDEADAQAAIKFINADKMLTVNIGEAASNLSIQGVEEFKKADGSITEAQVDFNKGNIKARLRMVAQYQAAAMYQGLVIGTDHNCEYIMAFYTRFGDEACDLTVLNGLSKRQIRLMAKEMGSPEFLWNKAPTADLEEMNPGKLDDDGFGFPYSYLEDFIEGIVIPLEVEVKIVNHFNNTRFKRAPIPGYADERNLS